MNAHRVLAAIRAFGPRCAVCGLMRFQESLTVRPWSRGRPVCARASECVVDGVARVDLATVEIERRLAATEALV